MTGGRYAAIDIGTVTSRILIAEVNEGRVHRLCKERCITNLGEGVDATRELSLAAMQRVEAAVSDFLKVYEVFDTPDDPILGMMAVATSAARDARNATDFEAMLSRLGVQLAVISGAEEAALTFAGATAAYQDERVMVVDAGGGSTEISLGCAGGMPATSHSFDIGCRRATERFLHTDPPTKDELASARAWMDDQFQTWFDQHARTFAATQRMIAVAGTATTAVSIREQMHEYDSSRVNGAHVTAEDLHHITERLAALPLEQRRQTIGLDPGRAPVIIGGMLILQSVMEAARIDAFTVSESDILDGMILHCACAQ